MPSILCSRRSSSDLGCFHTKKVQMKRSVTGGDADGCCPQRNSPCPTLVGRKTKALSEKADSDGVHVNMFIQ